MSLSFTTMVLFCLAMPKHREQVLSHELPSLLVIGFRPLAWLLLTITFYLNVDFYGWSIGPALFFGVLSASLLPLILLLTYRPKIVPLIALLSPVIGFIVPLPTA